MYSLARNSGLTDESPQNFYDTYVQYQQARLHQGQLDAQGDIRASNVELTFYNIRKPVYRVYPAIATALTTTNINIPSEEIQLPFDVFEIQLHPETFFLDEKTAHTFETSQSLVGKPYLCALLVSKANLFAPDLKLPPDTQALQIFWDIHDTGNPSNVFDARSYIGLIPNKLLSDGVDMFRAQHSFQATRADQERVAALVVGTIFMAISRNREWVKQVRIKLKGQDYCLCGSGRKYKRCCSKKNTQAGDPIGFSIGQTIDLPYKRGSSTGVMVEGRGDELQYSHIRSGHMRWQWKNDPIGQPFRELIFIAPTIVRPDLPMKPHLTPRQIRPQRPEQRRNPRDFHPLTYEGFEEPATSGYKQSEIYPRVIFADYLPLEPELVEAGNRWFYRNRQELPTELHNIKMQELFLRVSLGRYSDNTLLWVLTRGPNGPRLGSGMFVCSEHSPKRNDPEEGYHEDYTASLAFQGFGIYPAILKLMRQLAGPLRSDISLTPGAHKAWQRAGGIFTKNRYYINPDSDLASLIMQLDRALTGKVDTSTRERYPQNVEDWVDRSSTLVYLSDGGYSRIYLDIASESASLLLASESLPEVKARWLDEDVIMIRRSIEHLVREKMHDMGW